MKAVEKVCKPLKDKIEKRYMSNSLFIIDEEMIPRSQMDNAVKI